MKDYSTPAEGILKREADGTIASQEVVKVELVDLATVATSGSYNDLTNKPTIPAVNDATITIKQGSTTKGSFTTNQSSGKTITLDANTDTLGKNIVGTSATASSNGAVSGTDGVYLNHIEGTNTVKSTHKIVGSGATTVKSDANGNITINTPAAPVTSVNNKTGAVKLSASDVGAVGLTGSETILGNKTFYNNTTFIEPPEFFGGMHISGSTSYNENSTVDFTNATVTGLMTAAPVTSVNSKTGAVVLSASDVGAQPKITANGFLKGDGSGNITADKPMYVVTTTSSGSNLISNRTAKQIYDAYSAGYQVVASFSNEITPITVCLRDGEGTTDSPYSYTIIFDGPSSQQNVNQPDRGYFNNVIYAYGLTDSGDGFNAISATSVPTTRTINNKPLSANITLNASDVNAVGLTGNQTIAGDKTFNGNITFDDADNIGAEVTFIGGTTFQHTSTVVFNGARVFFDESTEVDFTNATVTGLHGLLPSVGLPDNGKFLRVVNGAWAAATVENANGVSF